MLRVPTYTATGKSIVSAVNLAMLERWGKEKSNENYSPKTARGGVHGFVFNRCQSSDADMKYEPQGPVHGKILVIDDNPIIQRQVYFMFRERGYKVFMSGDIAESLYIIRKEVPNLILLDINFPLETSIDGGSSRDGYWALDWIHRIEEARQIPIVMISSDDPAHAEPKALAKGAAAYFHKPIDKERLLLLVTEIIPPRPAPLAQNLAAALKPMPA